MDESLSADLYSEAAPSHWKFLKVPNRDPIFGRVYTTKSHSAVPKDHGTIYCTILDMTSDHMKKLYGHCVNMNIPKTEAERRKVGFLDLYPEQNDYLIWRNLYGSHLEEDDIVYTYAFAHNHHDPNTMNRLQEIQDRIYGPLELQGDEKPGIQFERSPYTVNHLGNAPRAYPFGNTTQVQKMTEYVATNHKFRGRALEEHHLLWKDVMQISTEVGAKFYEKVEPKLCELVHKQAERVNCNLMGNSKKSFWTSGQVNVASCDQEKNEPEGDGEAGGEEQGGIKGIGQFGTNHGDYGDSPNMKSHMLNMTRPDQKVLPQFFMLMEAGIGWRLDYFASFLFSGLGSHGGTGGEGNVRVTVINYAPEMQLDGVTAMALAALSRNVQGNVLTVSSELRDTSNHIYNTKAACETANLVTDGFGMADAQSYLDVTARAILEHCLGIISQAPMDTLPRINRDVFLSAFSLVDENNIRIQAKPWALGPGWTGENVQIGKTYSEDIRGLPEETVKELWNSDTVSDIPYGNQAMVDARLEWIALHQSRVPTHPVCHASGEVEEKLAIPPRLRKHARKKARTKAQSNAAQAAVNPLTRARTRTSTASKTQPAMPVTVTTKRKAMGPTPALVSSLVQSTGAKVKKSVKDLNIPFIKTLMDPQKSFTVNTRDHVPSSVSIPRNPDIAQIGTAWVALNRECRDHSIAGYILHQDTLLTHLVFWEKLETLKNNAITLLESLSSKPPPDCNRHWFLTLAVDFKEALELNVSSKTFKSDAYLPAAYRNGQVVDYKYRKPRNFGEDKAIMAVSLAHGCLMSWLGINDSSVSIAQAQLIRLLFNKVGVEILLQDSVWQGVRTLVPDIGWSKCAKPAAMSLDEWLNCQLEREGLCDPTSPIRTLLADFQRQIKGYRSDTEIERFDYLVEIVNSSPSSHPRLISGPTQPAPTAAVDETSSDEEYERQPQGSKRKRASRDVSKPRKRTKKPMTFAEKRRQMLLKDPRSDEQRRDTWAHGISLCKLLIPADGGPCTLPPPPPPADAQALRDYQFQTKVMDNLDFLQAHREFGHSRRKIRSLDENPSALRTKEGFFSMCVNRALHHNTDFLRDTDIMSFTSYENWEEVIHIAMAIKGKPWDDVYFRNPNAYSQNWSERSLDFAQVYWDSIQSNPEYTSWLVGTEKMSLSKIFRMLLRDRKHFPGMGELATLQILLDYCKEGIVTGTVEEYAEVFRFVNKGAVGGLIHLGFLEPHEGQRFYPVGELVQSLKQAKVFLQSKGLDLDFPDIEHSLCKAARHDKLRT
ncbi:hypothetical protein BDP27DRAFT_1425053 [Rhodocollybia butyracea]|uniref:Uncharacterized protein n=1 Tax=Rhodocollybia butyracea TaxID=206335 RepID=A0A9P5U450_9AGAR|nr:hypothetical protein BDP27DRAFT_1425053 [Rhodocollybia butyracea]